MADPLTFFYHLAAVAGGTPKKRETVYASVAKVFGLESDLDYTREDGFIFPIPPGLVVLFNNTGADPRLLWKMFDQARAFDGTSHRADYADTFARTLQIKGVGVPKLTQTLFLINPRAFLPFDAMAVLPLGIGRLAKPPAKMSWDEYVDEMRTIRAAFPGCHGYEVNVISYLWTSGHYRRKGNRWYQIGTNEDRWRQFRDNHWVHHGGQGDIRQTDEGEVLRDPKQDDRFDEPEPGDVVLVHTGTREGRGIGIVYRNDYGDQPHRNDRIHVLWVNKEQAPLPTDLPTVAFSRADDASYEAFAKSDAYSATLNLLEPLEAKTGGSGSGGKNINTLYGEFYRPLVARLRRKGVQPGVWRGRWRSFHTGYPGAINGTGLDDGKAKVFLSFRGAGSAQRFRALLSHRKEIDEKLKETASWLDEKQGSWRNTVLLERDRPFSLTGPEEDLEATRVWMTDSLLALKSAVQPHLDHVMQEPSPEPPSPASLVQRLTDCGLLFPRELVANYILALQTKRFVILTGISGTGKTQIAKALAELYGPARQAVVGKMPEDAFGIEVNPYQFRYSRIMIPVAVAANLDLLGPDAPLSKRKIQVRYPAGQVALTYNQNRQGATALLFRGEFKEWFRSNVNAGDQISLRVHEGESPDSDQLEIGLSETETVEAPVRNYEVVPVRPDWVDNRGLLGYLNPLTNEYSTTPFLDLLLRARAEERRAADAGEEPHPFFAILDEMNLARVEHYFSDFLSALESGEGIPLHTNETIESGESESGPRVPQELKVPGNVLFTGTVNVDETTYMFSPKVLDRAFTIEFDHVDLEGFTTGDASVEAPGLDLGGVDALDFLPSGRSDDVGWKPSRDDWAEFSQETPGHHKALLQLHSILERQHRHFGYRVANEIARFVNLAREQAGADVSDAAVDAAFDLALLQKVLPKFHGTQQELQSILEEIFQFAVHGSGRVPKKDQKVELDDWRVVKGRLVAKSKTQSPSDDTPGEGDDADSDAADPADADAKTPAYPRTGAKVLRMLHRLRDRGFTSFIE
ncbi:MAG: hypothetical protein F4Y24_08870 [Gemmatimonadetes bacterium]|nr:hypothetical protein [Gemmatimonadota bacterium]MYG22664.1 hypothetical protein [Gemmatimonadota bacterium]MYJ39135.1 hypothetical protein [Gemmatimonadota bacterium]